MADLEFMVTDADYSTDISEPAIYIDRSKAEKSVLVIAEQLPDINVDGADIGVRGIAKRVRVRKSEVEQPAKGDRVIYFDVEHCVDDYDELNVAEWWLYVVA